MTCVDVKILDKTYPVFGYPEEGWFKVLSRDGKFEEQNGFNLSSLRELIKPDFICLDIGASYGIFSLAMSQLAKQVLAFEPDWHPLQNTLMGITNVELHPYIVGKENYNGDFVVDTQWRSSNHFIPNPKGSASCRSIDSLRLDQVDFIKIDAEGSELDILEGAKETLERCKPIVLMEFNSYALIHYRNINPYDALYDIMEFFPNGIKYYQNNKLIPITDIDEFINLNREVLVNDLLCNASSN